MKIKMNVNKFEMYNFLIDNLKKELNVSKLKKGLKIQKDLKTKLNKEVKTSVEILDIQENVGYDLKYTSYFGENILSYAIEEIDEENIYLICKEKYLTNDLLKRINNLIMTLIFSFSLRRKKKKMFKEIEKYIHSLRK